MVAKFIHFAAGFENDKTLQHLKMPLLRKCGQVPQLFMHFVIVFNLCANSHKLNVGEVQNIKMTSIITNKCLPKESVTKFSCFLLELV